jgi:hypothetical protein
MTKTPMTATEMLAIAPILENSVRQTLEIMCFAEAEAIAPAPPSSSSLTALVSFSGDRSGSLQLAAEPRAAHALATAFLGLNDSSDPPKTLTGDTLRELAGVVCGRLLSAVNPTARFEMQVSPGNSRAHNSQNTLQQSFRLASGDLQVGLQFA